MFAFGDRRWPGLAKLAEEAGEVVQVIGKLMMTRGEVDHWDCHVESKPLLNERLADEMADCTAAILFVLDHFTTDGLKERYNARVVIKLALFNRWHREQATGKD